MAGKITITFKDHAGQSSTFNLPTDDVNAGNLAAIQALNSALVSALEGVTLGNVVRIAFLADFDEPTEASASSKFARRENKWLLRLVDSVTGENITRELPTADLALTTLNGEDADMASAAWIALKSAIDGNYNNPELPNSLTLVGAKFVGRNL